MEKRSGRARPEPNEAQLKCEHLRISVTAPFKKRLMDYCDDRGLTHAEFIRVTLADKMAEAQK